MKISKEELINIIGYIALFRQDELLKALLKKGFKYQGATKTILALKVVEVVIVNEMNFETVKNWLNEKRS